MSIGKAFARLFSTLWSAADGIRKVLHLLILLIIFSIVIGALSSTTPSIPGKAKEPQVILSQTAQKGKGRITPTKSYN